jgi:hypothetical protein
MAQIDYSTGMPEEHDIPAPVMTIIRSEQPTNWLNALSPLETSLLVVC